MPSRAFYGLPQNFVQNFVNLDFNGGYFNIPGSSFPPPAGWNIDPTTNVNAGLPAVVTDFSISADTATIVASQSFTAGMTVVVQGLSVGTYLNGESLVVLAAGLSGSSFRASFVHADAGLTPDAGSVTPIQVNAGITASSVPNSGDAYYIFNETGATVAAPLGMIVQSAFQDVNNVPILLPNVPYNIEIVASIPSGIGTGQLKIDLSKFTAGVGWSPPYGVFAVNLSSMAVQPKTFAGTLLASPGFTFAGGTPPGLYLRLYATGLPNEGDVLIDRIRIYPTRTPVNASTVLVSYVDEFEAMDIVSGNIVLPGTEPCFGSFEMYDTLYFLQSTHTQSTNDVPGVEPSGQDGKPAWAVREVSNRMGTCGLHSFDVGEEWVVSACRNGVFLFNGRQPVRIDFLTKEVWEAINWKASTTILVRNDMPNRRILVAVPLPTPNPWMPFAPLNADPASPNVVIMFNYQSQDIFEEIVTGKGLHTTMFGTLASIDMRVKVSLWNIATPYMGFCTDSTLISQPLTICNANGSGKLYRLSASQATDDGAQIKSGYCTYGFVNSAKSKEYPLLGFHRKRYQGMQTLLQGSGSAFATVYPNWTWKGAVGSAQTFNPHAYTIPGNFTLQNPPDDDQWRPLNIGGQRAFVFVGSNASGAIWNLSKMILVGTATRVRGSTQILGKDIWLLESHWTADANCQRSGKAIHSWATCSSG